MPRRNHFNVASALPAHRRSGNCKRREKRQWKAEAGFHKRVIQAAGCLLWKYSDEIYGWGLCGANVFTLGGRVWAPRERVVCFTFIFYFSTSVRLFLRWTDSAKQFCIVSNGWQQHKTAATFMLPRIPLLNFAQNLQLPNAARSSQRRCRRTKATMENVNKLMIVDDAYTGYIDITLDSKTSQRFCFTSDIRCYYKN